MVFGILFRHVHKNPINATVVDNDLRGNAAAPVIGQINAKTPAAIPFATGIFARNRGLDDGVIKKSHKL